MKAQNTCGYAGCKQTPAYELTQTVGSKNTLPCCEKHAPAWAKALSPPVHKGVSFYTVRKLDQVAA